MSFELYVLTFASGKKYVGVTRKGLASRMAMHATNVRCGKDTAVYRAWRAHGEPKAEVVASFGSEREMLEAEAALIADLCCFGENGYNSTPGGEFCPTLVPEIAARGAETRRAMQEAGIYKMQGHAWTEESRAKISATNKRLGRKPPGGSWKGRKHTEEAKAKQRAAKANMSAETREKMSIAKKAWWAARKAST